MSKDATSLARQHTEAAIAALVSIMNDEVLAKPSEVIAAATAILDRGHGKPMQSVMAINASSELEKLTGMTDGELLAAIGEYRMAQRRALPALEAEVVDPLAM